MEWQAERKTETLEAENAALKARPAAPDYEAMREREYDEVVYPQLVAIAEENGLDYPSLIGELQQGMSRLKPGESWRPFITEIRKRIVAKGVSIREAAKPVPRAETSRASGGGNTVKARYDLWMAGKGPRPSDEEIDSLTASYATRT